MEQMPAHLIEHAPSGRSRCKGCRRAIAKGSLRVGFMVEGPYGPGYLWHHLKCAARRRPDDLAAAYRASAWENAKKPVEKVPDLESVMKSVAADSAKKTERREIPYAELDPSGRAKCKQCGEPLAKGAPRVVVGRKVEFGNQVRVGPINVHPTCVAAALQAEDSGTSADGFAEALRANSTDLATEQIDEVLGTIGDLRAGGA